jgi:hypothetical protein
MALTLPVTWRLDDGTPTADTIAGKPCISLGFTPQLSPTGNFNNGDILRVNAIVDTGCDNTLIDERICGSAFVTGRRLLLVTHNGATQVDVRKGTLIFFGQDSNLAQETEFASTPMNKEAYSIMIGRSFLQSCNLTYDGKNGLASLTIFG